MADTATFDAETRAAFEAYLRANPNNRRVTQADAATILEWLNDPHKRPKDQAEHSRRNYVRRTFQWDVATQQLISVGPTDGGDKRRWVVTEDRIADAVEYIHEAILHRGWDATWRQVSQTYYGVLRADVIFLLRRCRRCAQNPTKAPKTPVRR